MEMEQIKMDACKIADMKKRLMEAACSEISTGLESVDAKELGEVIDMIKDLAQAEADCMKAKYYETVIEAMSEGEEPVYGYNARRYSSGRYAPAGRGHYGYTVPVEPYMNEDAYVRGWMNDPEFVSKMSRERYGYSGNPNRGSSDGNRAMSVNPTYGSMGYVRYGKPYEDYMTSRKYYTETHDQTAKEEMVRHMNEHINDTVTTIRDMYDGAEPDLKARIKEDITKLATSLK